MERLAVLGSTGSIGTQTLEVVRANPGRFEVAGLAAGANIALLAEQIREFSPKYVVTGSEESALELRTSGFSSVLSGREACEKMASAGDIDIVVGAIVGFEGLYSVLAAAKNGKRIALANKECLAAAGSLLMGEAKRSGAEIVPVDSEHSSIYQCLNRRGAHEEPRRVIITASGGPFLRTPFEELAGVKPEAALKHPTWSMGAKNTIDSATLMNKGLEVIEAAVLFDLPPEKIEVLVHPESIVHGFVEYGEGSVVATMFVPDMRVPIAYALKTLAPECSALGSGASWLDLRQRALNFQTPDGKRFPALSLAYQALRMGGSAPAILNAANESAVESFLSGGIGFLDIPAVVQQVLETETKRNIERIEDVVGSDTDARQSASKIIAQICEEKRN